MELSNNDASIIGADNPLAAVTEWGLFRVTSSSPAQTHLTAEHWRAWITRTAWT